MAGNMEDNMKIIVVATAGGIEIVVEGEKSWRRLYASTFEATGYRTPSKHTEHHVQDRGKAITNYWWIRPYYPIYFSSQGGEEEGFPLFIDNLSLFFYTA